MVPVARHVRCVPVEGIPGDQPGIEIGEEGGGASEGAQGKEPLEVEGAWSGRFHDILAYRTGCEVEEYRLSVSRAEQVEPGTEVVLPEVGICTRSGPHPMMIPKPEP